MYSSLYTRLSYGTTNFCRRPVSLVGRSRIIVTALKRLKCNVQIILDKTWRYSHRHLNSFQENNIWISNLHCVRSQLTLCTKPTVRLVRFTQSVLFFFRVYSITYLPLPPPKPCIVSLPLPAAVSKITSGGARNGFVTGAPFIAPPSTEVLSQSKAETAGNLEHFDTLKFNCSCD